MKHFTPIMAFIIVMICTNACSGSSSTTSSSSSSSSALPSPSVNCGGNPCVD